MASLLSVNVGMPKDVEWHGKTVHTGIWKSPVAGPLMARRLNLDGDGQGDLAGHGGEQRAVLVYQAESIAYWRSFLGLDDAAPGVAPAPASGSVPGGPAPGSAPASASDDDAVPGAAPASAPTSVPELRFGVFGENFTVDGLADDEVCIGDRYRIGEAEFEVTQPRVTCYRLGLRLDTPTLPSLLVEHHRPGFYMRVITEGHVRAGDAITRTRQGPHALSVADTDALLYLPDRDRSRLAVAVDIPALSPGWRQSFQDLLDDKHGGSAAAPPIGTEPDWTGFRPLRVDSVVTESSTIVSVCLAPQDGGKLPAAQPGQYLTLRFPEMADPAPVRSYSLSSAPGSDMYRISVKREGLVSTYVYTELQAGASVQAAAPRGEFVLASGTEPVVLISAGVGVTPVLAMLHQLAADRTAREVWWLHTSHDAEQQAFAQEAHTLLGELPGAHESVFYTAAASADSPPAADGASAAHVVHGRLTSKALAGLGLPSGASAYICGPQGFMTDMTEALVDLGLDKGAVHTELFGTSAPINPGVVSSGQASPHPPAGQPGTGPLVTFVRSGLSAPWNAAIARSLLEFAEACDVPTRWACRSGVCHTCVTELLAGDADYRPDPLEPPASGQLLICCSHPTSDIVLDM